MSCKDEKNPPNNLQEDPKKFDPGWPHRGVVFAGGEENDSKKRRCAHHEIANYLPGFVATGGRRGGATEEGGRNVKRSKKKGMLERAEGVSRSPRMEGIHGVNHYLPLPLKGKLGVQKRTGISSAEEALFRIEPKSLRENRRSRGHQKALPYPSKVVPAAKAH